MCLDVVEKPIRKWGVGYKLASKRNGEYYSCDYATKIGFHYQKDGWITDPNTEQIKAYDGTMYEPGFHIMLTKTSWVVKSSNNTLIKVRFRKAMAGQSEDANYGPSVVAKEMRIIEEVNNVY